MAPGGVWRVTCTGHVMLLLTIGAHAFQWTSDIQNGGKLRRCVGDNVTFPWSYVTESEENVTVQFWFSNKGGTIAIYFADHFMTSWDRVTQAGRAGMTLYNVSTADDDTYGVSVTLYERQQPLMQHITLTVVEPPRTTDGQLHVIQHTQNSTVGRNTLLPHRRLKCGNFQSLGSPNVTVFWTDPSGNRLPSTTFRDGYFHLDLDPHARGGNYTCSVQHEAKGTQCLASDSLLLMAAGYRLVTIETVVSDQGTELRQLRRTLEELSQQVALSHVTHTNTSGALRVTVTALEQRQTNLTEVMEGQVAELHNTETELLQVSVEQNNTISGLKSQVADLQTKNTDQNTQVSSLQSQVAGLQKKNRDHNTQVSSLQSQVAGLQKQNTDQNTQVSSLQSQVADLQKKNTDQNTQISSLQSQVADLKNIVLELRRISLRHHTQIPGLQTQVTAQNNLITDLQKQNTNKNFQISSLQTQVTDQNTQISTLQKQVTDQNTQISSLQNQVTDQNTQISDLQKQVTDQNTQISSLQKQVTDQNTQISGLQNQVTDQNTQISGMQNQVTNQNMQISGLQKQMTDQNNQISGLQKQVTEQNTQISGLQNQITSQNTQISGLQKQTTDQNTQISSLKTENTDQKTQISSLRTQVTTQNSQISGLQNQISSQNNQISRISQWDRTLATLKRDFDEFRALTNLKIATAASSVSFYAQRTTWEHTLNANDTLIFNVVITNEGGAYSNTTGVFTVPVDGTYAFFITVMTHSTSETKNTIVHLAVDTTWIPCRAYSSYESGQLESNSCSVVLFLKAGRRVYVKSHTSNSRYYPQTLFSGALLHAAMR